VIVVGDGVVAVVALWRVGPPVPLEGEELHRELVVAGLQGVIAGPV
jgi:hypothetical protein